MRSRKHDVRFEEAATAFFDPQFVLVDASRKEEARYAAIGFDATGRLLYVVIPVNVVDSLKQIAPLKGCSGYQPPLKAYIGEGLRQEEAKFAPDQMARLIEAKTAEYRKRCWTSPHATCRLPDAGNKSAPVLRR